LNENINARKTVAIIGAGHNGLTAAAYLAQGGYEVTVYEKRQTAGGLCVTEKPFAKFGSQVKVSTVASYFGMLRKEIMDDLKLEGFGLKPYLTNPIEIVLLEKGQFSFTPREGGEARCEIDSLTAADQAGWQQFWADLQKAAALIYPHYLHSNFTQSDVVALLVAASLDKIATHIFAGSLLDLLSQYAQNEDLMAVAATCTPGFANIAGSVFGCIHHGTAQTAGEFGAWGQVYGGMGEITSALTKAAQSYGAKIITAAAVSKLIVDDGKVVQVEFQSGQTKSFDIVVANCDSYMLFEKLIAPLAETEAVRHYLETNRPKVSAKIGHNHKGVIVIAPAIEQVKQASEGVAAGRMPEKLMLTMAFPTLEDSSIADLQNHLLTVDIHYVPARISANSAAAPAAWSEADDAKLLEMTIVTIEEQCAEIRDLIEQSYVVSPRALAETYNLASLSCWHMPMTPDYLFEKRSLPKCAPYETPLRNLFICGAGTYPGGNVTAANGHNLAKHLLELHPSGQKEVECQLQA